MRTLSVYLQQVLPTAASTQRKSHSSTSCGFEPFCGQLNSFQRNQLAALSCSGIDLVFSTEAKPTLKTLLCFIFLRKFQNPMAPEELLSLCATLCLKETKTSGDETRGTGPLSVSKYNATFYRSFCLTTKQYNSRPFNTN